MGKPLEGRLLDGVGTVRLNGRGIGLPLGNTMTLSTEIDRFIGSIAAGLVRQNDNFWRSKTDEAISYPDDAHADYASLEAASYWFGHRNNCILSMVRRFPPDGPILDVGGGNGFVSKALVEAGYPAIVMEPGPHGARTARKRGLPVMQASLEAARISDGSIPAVAMFDVLEHIEDDHNALAEVHRILKPGGLFYITVPALRWLWSSEDTAAGHFRRYSRTSLAKRLTAAGLEVQTATYMFAPLVPAVLIARALPSLVGIAPQSRRDPAQDHTLPNNLLGRSLRRTLDAEYRRLESNGTIAIGTSVLAVARRCR